MYVCSSTSFILTSKILILLVTYEHFWVVWTSWLVLKTSKGLFNGSDLVLRLVKLGLRLDV